VADAMIKALRGTSARYLYKRLKKQRADLADAFDRGEYPTVYDAAKAAGWVRDATPLDRLRRAWNKASDDEKRRFVHEVVTSESDRQMLARELALMRGA
jgi:hypothetical protein